MKGPENRFIESVHGGLPLVVYCEKMHNPYRGGTFDVWYSGQRGDLWVEYKWDDNKLSELQKEWGRARFKEGRKVYVIIGDPEGGVLYTTPEKWESLKGGKRLTKPQIVKWLIKQAHGDKIDAEDLKRTRRSSKKRRQRVQNTSNRSADIRTSQI